MRNLVGRWLCWLVLSGSFALAQVAVATYRNDNYRSGANPQETILTLNNVSVQQFGRLATFPVLGQVYAQPLYVPGVRIGTASHNMVVIATEHDQVYAFDTTTYQQLWHANLLKAPDRRILVSPVSNTDVFCTDLRPEIGITSTPVIDVPSATLYTLAIMKYYDRHNNSTTFHQFLHAIDLTTGRDKVLRHEVSATAPGNGTGSVSGILTFDPLIEGQRGGLLLVNGEVYVGWASYCDNGNYHGWLMSFDKTTLAAHDVFVDTPNGYEGGFWASGAGPAADRRGAIFVPTGNGDFAPDSGDYGDSILRLEVQCGRQGANRPCRRGRLAVVDYFTPWDQQTLDMNDIDVASGGLLLLPDQPSSRYPHLLVQVGKEGTIDLVNRDNMGHWHAGDDSQIVQTLPYAIGAMWGSPAAWNNYVYFGGVNDYLKAYTFDPQTQLLSTSPTSQSPAQFYAPAPMPAVSSNGVNNGILWALESDGANQGYAVLHAFLATNLAIELYYSEQNPSRDRAGLSVKFTVPTIADGHVFVGGQNQVTMYGLLFEHDAQRSPKRIAGSNRHDVVARPH